MFRPALKKQNKGTCTQLQLASLNCIKFSAVTLEITFDCVTATPLKVTFRGSITGRIHSKYKFMEILRINLICYWNNGFKKQ